MSDSEKKKSEKEHLRHFLHKMNNQEVSRSFTLKSCKTTAQKSTKKECCSYKVAFLLIRPIVVFFTVLVMSIYRARTRTRTSSQDSSQNSAIFHFSPSPLRGGFSWQSWKESSSQGQGQVRVKARVRVRFGLVVGELGVLFVALILRLFISLLRTLLIL